MNHFPESAENHERIDQALKEGRITPTAHASIKRQWEDKRLEKTWGV